MGSAKEVKGLHDVRTAISTHYRTTSRHKGTPYLEVLSLGMEKLRLEADLARLTTRQERIETRLGEIEQFLGERLAQVRGGPRGGEPAGETRGAAGVAERRRSIPPSLRRMTVGY